MVDPRQPPLPPTSRYRLRLRLTEPVRFPFHHGGVLRGLVSRALGRHDLPVGLIANLPESGQVEYAAGDGYHLGVTLVGEARALAPELVQGLARLGAGDRTGRGRPDGHRPPTLGGNFRVEDLEPLPLPDLEDEVAALAGRRSLTFRALSPLRIRRPDDLVEKGAAYLNGDCFPAACFLDALERRRLRLAAPADRPTASDALPPPADLDRYRLRAEPGPMPWLDVPVPGSPRKGRSYTVGGVLGTVVLHDVPPSLLPALVLGSHLHVGGSTAYGLGRYRIPELGPPDPLERPARTLLERAATVQRVLEAAEAEPTDGHHPGGGTPATTVDSVKLARELATGTWRPAPCEGTRPGPPADRPAPSCPCAPCRSHRIVQRTLATVLEPSVETYLESSSWAFRAGYSRAGARRAWQRREGFRVRQDGLDHLRRQPLPDTVEDLGRALFPADPALTLLSHLLSSAPPLTPALWHPLALLTLHHLDRSLGPALRIVRHGGEIVVVERLERSDQRAARR